MQYFLFIKAIHQMIFPPKHGKWLFWGMNCQYFCLASVYPLSTQFGCNLSEASRWSPVLQQMARLKMNETQLKVSPYTLVPGNGCWRRQFRSFEEQSITGKADGLVLLKAETLPYIIQCNCTNPHKMVRTSNHFSTAQPFLMIISFLKRALSLHC